MQLLLQSSLAKFFFFFIKVWTFTLHEFKLHEPIQHSWRKLLILSATLKFFDLRILLWRLLTHIHLLIIHNMWISPSTQKKQDSLSWITLFHCYMKDCFSLHINVIDISTPSEYFPETTHQLFLQEYGQQSVSLIIFNINILSSHCEIINYVQIVILCCVDNWCLPLDILDCEISSIVTEVLNYSDILSFDRHEDRGIFSFLFVLIINQSLLFYQEFDCRIVIIIDRKSQGTDSIFSSLIHIRTMINEKLSDVKVRLETWSKSKSTDSIEVWNIKRKAWFNKHFYYVRKVPLDCDMKGIVLILGIRIKYANSFHCKLLHDSTMTIVSCHPETISSFWLHFDMNIKSRIQKD